MTGAAKSKDSIKTSKKQQVLQAATFLFTEQGYSSTSMDLIAKHAGVSKQTVYSHFGSKDLLFAASIKQKCDSYHILDLSIQGVLEPRSILMTLAERFLMMLTSKEALAVHKICAYEAKSYPQLSELFYQEGPERITNEVAKLMQQLHDNKLLSIPNARYAALQFLNMMKGEVWMRVEFNTKQQLTTQEVERYLCSSIDLFIRGYAISN